jgi:hypothetical protein
VKTTKRKIMGWANCGTDSEGRPIGYAHKGTCDHPGCKAVIDRGLSFACGGMHGSNEYSCEKYFCEEHLSHCVQTDQDDLISVCDACAEALIASGEFHEDEEEGVIVRTKPIETP